MKFFLLINVKMLTIGILTFMSGENSILGLSEPKKGRISWYFYTYEHLQFHAQLSWAWKKFYNLGARALQNRERSCCYQKRPSEPATFVQRLPNVFQTPMGVWNTLGSRCTNIAGSRGDGQWSASRGSSLSVSKYCVLLLTSMKGWHFLQMKVLKIGEITIYKD